MQTFHSTDTERNLAIELILEDIPGGGVIARDQIPTTTEELQAGALVAESSDGVWHLTKTAMLANALNAGSGGNHIIVYNNHEFKVGDYLQNTANTASGVLIAAIAASGTGKDVISYATGASGLCVSIAASGLVIQAATGTARALGFLYSPTAITTNTVDLAASGNNGCGLLVRGRVRESEMPYPVDATVKALLPLIRFV